MKQVIVSKSAEKKIRAGVQLLEERDFPAGDLPQGLVELVNQAGQPLSRAYLAPQQKGLGWVLPGCPETLSQAYLVDLFKKSRDRRLAYEQSRATNAYRLFNQDGDGFGGLTIDRYGDFALFSIYNRQVARWLDALVTAFREVYPDLLGAYAKWRYQEASQDSSHLYGQEAPESFLVLENGVQYSVFLNDGLMTGIFLDQHEVRGRLVEGLAAGKRVLNLFSYTAAFSVAAAMGGACETTSVDLAKRSRDLSTAHFEANGLDLAPHGLVVMDVFDYFRYAKRHNLTYDLIILDPPSFARNKKQTFSVARDYHRLVSQSLDLLTPKGILIASTNASNLSRHQFEQDIRKGMGDRPYKLLYQDGLPGDFVTNAKDPRSDYLKVLTFEVD